jgi:GntR family transcriptional regulator
MRVYGASEAPFDKVPSWSREQGPAHASIEQWIEGLVRDGVLTPGDRLPPESELAARFSVSRMTLRQALSALEEKLLIQRRRGRGGGTFVREPRIEHDLTGLPGFTEQLLRSAVRPGGVIVSAEQVDPSEEVRTALGLGLGEQVYRVAKTRLANDEPIALEDTFLPASLFPGLLDRDLTGSLYALMSGEYGHVPATASEELEPAVAGAVEAGLLAVEVGALLMRVIRTTETSEGLVIEFARDLFRVDRARITMRSQISAAASLGAVTDTG